MHREGEGEGERATNIREVGTRPIAIPVVARCAYEQIHACRRARNDDGLSAAREEENGKMQCNLVAQLTCSPNNIFVRLSNIALTRNTVRHAKYARSVHSASERKESENIRRLLERMDRSAVRREKARA